MVKGILKLKERINEEKLRECISCSNLPIKNNDKSEDIINKKEAIRNYLKIKKDKNGYRTITYSQKTDKLYMGRYSTSSGLALFPKEIKKYVSGEFYKDIDIVNCHPILMKKILTDNDIPVCVFLNDYINDRYKAIKDYKLKDKNDIYIIMNDESCYNDNQYIKEFHSSIYGLLFNKLIKSQQYKKLWKWCEGKDKDNKKGTFISYMLQDYERKIIEVCFNYCRLNNIPYEVFCYDGFMIDKNYDISLEELAKIVKQETGFEVDFIYKDMETGWEPIKNEIDITEDIVEEDYTTFNLDYAVSLHQDKEDIDLFMDYMNNFFCIFKKPLCIGFRDKTSEEYEYYNKQDIDLRVGVYSIFETWKSNSKRKVYESQDFIINEKDLEEGVYNRYKRPVMEENKNILEDCKIVFDFIKEVISNNKENDYRWLLDWISICLKEGKTGIAIVLIGLMGCGKSTFHYLMKMLVGSKYDYTINNIKTLTAEYNGHFKDKIIICLEELSYNAMEYHKIHNILKDKITNEYQNIRELYKNGYMARDQCNYIYLSNFDYVVPITEDNRRHYIQKVDDKHKGDNEYFNELYLCIKNNIKGLRYFFYNREIINKHLAKSRPITEQELKTLERSKSTIELFLESYFEDNNEELNEINKKDAYFLYTDFCKSINEKPKALLYFTDDMIKAGYKLKQIRIDNKRVNIFIKN